MKGRLQKESFNHLNPSITACTASFDTTNSAFCPQSSCSSCK